MKICPECIELLILQKKIMIIKVSNCNNCPFKVENFDGNAVGYDTLLECQLNIFLNRNLSYDIREETTITVYDSFTGDGDNIDTPDWCPLHECKIIRNE